VLFTRSEIVLQGGARREHGSDLLLLVRGLQKRRGLTLGERDRATAEYGKQTRHACQQAISATNQQVPIRSHELHYSRTTLKA
jgi:hypothetical protein